MAPFFQTLTDKINYLLCSDPRTASEFRNPNSLPIGRQAHLDAPTYLWMTPKHSEQSYHQQIFYQAGETKSRIGI
jgi:hypothetical protein